MKQNTNKIGMPYDYEPNEVYNDEEQRAKLTKYNRLLLVDLIGQQSEEIKRLKDKIEAKDRIISDLTNTLTGNRGL